MADEQKLKKGDAAPLEGVLGKEIMFVLNLAFIGIGLGMLQGLALKAGQALPRNDQSGPGFSSIASPAPQVAAITPPAPPSFGGGPSL